MTNRQLDRKRSVAVNQAHSGSEGELVCTDQSVIYREENQTQSGRQIQYRDIELVATNTTNPEDGFTTISIGFLISGVFLLYLSYFYTNVAEHVLTWEVRSMLYASTLLSFPTAYYMYSLNERPRKELTLSTNGDEYRFQTKNDFHEVDRIAKLIREQCLAAPHTSIRNRDPQISRSHSAGRLPNGGPDLDTTSPDEDTEKIRNKVSDADDLRSVATDHQNSGDFAQSLAAFKRAKATYESALEAVTEDTSVEVDSIRGKLSTTEAEIEQTAKRKVSKDISEIDMAFGRTRNSLEDGSFQKAESSIKEIGSDISSLREFVNDHDLEQFGDSLQRLTQERENLCEEIRKGRLRSEIRSRVDDLRTSISQLSEGIDEDSLLENQQKLVKFESRVDSITEETQQHDFQGLQKNITDIEQQRQNLLSKVIDRRKSLFVPDDIPHLPNRELRYENFSEMTIIGRGGNADVSKVSLQDPEQDLQLAIKNPRLAGTIHREMVERLLQEAEIWDKLDSHDHIVDIVDWGSKPVPWIAMEYMDGGHLGERAQEMGTLQAFWTAIVVTKGVRHAHRKGIAHLDLKPENILFQSMDGSWDIPKVADWGLSKHLLEHSSSVEGLSPRYAAPEQFSDEHGSVNELTDVYQLGAVFYELFTKQPLFDGSPAKTMHKVLNESPTPPTELADVPEELDDILLTALEKEQQDRFESVLLLRKELERVYEDLWYRV